MEFRTVAKQAEVKHLETDPKPKMVLSHTVWSILSFVEQCVNEFSYVSFISTTAIAIAGMSYAWCNRLIVSIFVSSIIPAFYKKIATWSIMADFESEP